MIKFNWNQLNYSILDVYKIYWIPSFPMHLFRWNFIFWVNFYLLDMIDKVLGFDQPAPNRRRKADNAS